MTCRDILISELKRLGADGLICPKVYCDCHCTMDEYRFLCGYDDCTPAKLIDGEWEAVEVVTDNCPGLLSSSPKCHYWNGKACTDKEEFTNNGELCCRYHANAVKVEDNKEYCEYSYTDYVYSQGKCLAQASCGVSWCGDIELLHNFKHCPECGKEIREVK